MSALLFLVAVLVIGLLLVAVISRGSSSKPSRPRRSRSGNRVGGIDREFVARKWQTIEMITSGGGSLRDAVMEADTLVDYAMKQSGVPGDTMGERLKHAGSRFSNVNNIWTAHKLRNALAHEAAFDLVPTQAREAVTYFRQGLKDLGAL
jgi:hypothetical protein